MRVLLDANIVIDVLEKRSGSFQASYDVVRLAAEGSIEAIVPSGSISDIYFIIRKSVVDSTAAHNAIAAFLQLVEVCDTTSGDIITALSLDFSDLEDAILAATAKRERVDYLITRDLHGFIHSPVRAVTPSEFFELYKAAT